MVTTKKRAGRRNFSELITMNDSPEPDSTSTRKRRWGRVGLLLGLLFVAMCMTAYFMLFHRPGIDVTIQNSCNQPLRSVILVVTGDSYNLDGLRQTAWLKQPPNVPETPTWRSNSKMKSGKQSGLMREASLSRATDHPLAIEQRDGVTMNRVKEIAEALLHPD